GKLKNELGLLIKNLGLENNVYLKNYTSNPKETYSEAACSILTSRQEGFAMVITESMSVGTAVVSYSTKYGPRDIIENEVDGYVVAQGNTELLAEKSIDIMKDTDLRDKVSENALLVNDTFRKVKYRKSCNELAKY